jgi:hypothetical protein
MTTTEIASEMGKYRRLDEYLACIVYVAAGRLCCQFSKKAAALYGK